MARFTRAKTKDCPQVPGTSSTNRWLGSVSLWKRPRLCGHTPAPFQAQEGRDPDAELLCVLFSHPRVCHRGCAWATTSLHVGTRTNELLDEPWAFVKLWLYYLRLGKEQAVFKPPGLFPGPSQASAGPSPCAILPLTMQASAQELPSTGSLPPQ